MATQIAEFRLDGIWRYLPPGMRGLWEATPLSQIPEAALLGAVVVAAVFILWAFAQPRRSSSPSTRSLARSAGGTTCGVCGKVALPGARYCDQCGSALAWTPDVSALPVAPLPASSVLAPLNTQVLARPIRQRPTWVVILLMIITLGFYWPVWFAQTWSELKRATNDPRMHPFGHGLALFVPLYGLERIHAHFRRINDLTDTHGVKRGVGPGWALSLVLLSIIPFVGLVTFPSIMVSGQRALNRIWRDAYGIASEKRAVTGEWFSILAISAGIVAAGYFGSTNPNSAQYIARINDCQGWSSYLPAHDRMLSEETAFWDDLDTDAFPAEADYRRWSLAARSIRIGYQRLDTPQVVKAFVNPKVSAFQHSEDGFDLLADGSRTAGNSRLDAGDRANAATDADLDTANAKCVGT